MVGHEQATGEWSGQVSYVTLDEFIFHMALETLNRKVRQDWKDAMEKPAHEEQSRNWPPPNYELENFRCTHPSAVDGYSEFVLRKSAVQPVIGSPTIDLLLLPRNPQRGSVRVARCALGSGSGLDWELTCNYSVVGAVTAVISRATTFLRNLLEQPARVRLPVDCDWIYLDDRLCVRDGRNGTVYPVPNDARRADVLDAVVKEYWRTHRGRVRAVDGKEVAGLIGMVCEVK